MKPIIVVRISPSELIVIHSKERYEESSSTLMYKYTVGEEEAERMPDPITEVI